MPEPRTVTVYIDYKSPYAYLAKDLAYGLERDFPVRLDWLPYVLDIPSFLGSARLDESGQVVEEDDGSSAPQRREAVAGNHQSNLHRVKGRPQPGGCRSI